MKSNSILAIFVIIISLSSCNKYIEYTPEVIPEVVDVFIVAGQSNSDGRIYITEAPFWVDQQNPIIEGVQVWLPTEDQFVDFKIGVNTGAAVSSTKLWGYDMLFFHKYYQFSNKPIYVVKRTQGGTPIYNNTSITKGCWNANFSAIPPGTPKLLQELEQRYIGAKAYFDAAGKEMNVIAVMWHQGESDFAPEAAYNNYFTNYSNVLNYIRNTIVKDPNLPVVLGTVPHKSHQYNSVVEEAHYSAANNDPNIYIVDMQNGDLLPDGLHFNASGAETFAEGMFQIIKKF